jgi:hypothetical protein
VIRHARSGGAPTARCQPGAACGMPGGDNTLTGGPGAERERLTGGTSRQILF